jgi:Tol biopolymer transport system component
MFFVASFSRIAMSADVVSAPTGTADPGRAATVRKAAAPRSALTVSAPTGTAASGRTAPAKKAVAPRSALTVTAPTGIADPGRSPAAGKIAPPSVVITPPFSIVPSITTGATVTVESGAEEKKQETIEPLFVRPLVKIEPGRNDSNPQWSPRGTLVAFERSSGDRKELVIARPDGSVVQTIYFQLSEGSKEAKFFFPGVYEEVSYNAGLSWSPAGDRVVFMSNGGEGSYDLYVREVSSKATSTTTRLTDYKEKNGHAHWSPVSDSIIFVSGRTGKGDVYLFDLATRGTKRLTQGGKPYLYPQWSPDGKKIAMIYGSNENHDIYVIGDVARPVETFKALTTWSADDLRPVWSPDGKKIAFYTNYNAAGDPRLWSLIVVAADGTGPTRGDGLAAKVVAQDIIPDVERGPAWMSDSSRIVYVKNDKQGYNPIYIVDVKEKSSLLIKTDTKMNHDIACAPDGTIAFRAQVNQWDQIFLMKLKQ